MEHATRRDDDGDGSPAESRLTSGSGAEPPDTHGHDKADTTGSNDGPNTTVESGSGLAPPDFNIKSVTSIGDVSSITHQKHPQYYPRGGKPTRNYQTSPSAWEDQVLYFLLPDRFSDSSEKATNIYDQSSEGSAIGSAGLAQAWRDAGARFVGGSLQGLKSKLGYLKSLGISALWVGPIFKQVRWLETYHGYGVQDFLDVDPRFGTRDDLRDLVEAAHEKEMYVILDIILNHSGDVFKYKLHDPAYTGSTYEVEGFYAAQDNASVPFGPVGNSNFPDGAVWPKELQDKDCFTRKGRIHNWDTEPEFLDGDFFDLKDITLGAKEPDNFAAPSALRLLSEVYKFWVAYADIDGYRIDTVKHMGDGPTRYFASTVHEYAQTIGKDKFLLIGEITGSRAYETVETTGLDAALGIGNVQEKLWKVPYGEVNPEEYFNLFRNSLFLNKGSHTWFRDKVVTMIDDHDQVWKGDTKGRFCSVPDNEKLVAAALMMNLCTLGIPCIYYGTEQAFDGEGGSDRYIREAMFGGTFGAFRSNGHHCFDQNKDVYRAVSRVAEIRRQEIALRRGRQYLRDISGDGQHFGPTRKIGEGRVQGIVAWSRLFASEEVLCAINTDPKMGHDAYINLDNEIHPPGSSIKWLYNGVGGGGVGGLPVEFVAGRSAVHVKINPGGFIIMK